jgi:hypothetical protein
MKARPDKRKERQPYRPPKLRTVELAVPEVLGDACKNQSGTGMDTYCDGPPACFDTGS